MMALMVKAKGGAAVTPPPPIVTSPILTEGGMALSTEDNEILVEE